MDLEALYLKLHLRVLPRGRAWAKEVGSLLYELMDGMKQEWVRVHERALLLLEESQPETCNELLPEWEQFLKLPDDCDLDAQEFEDRRNQVIAKYRLKGGQSPAFMVALAERLGYTVTTRNYLPFQCGRSACGDSLYTDPLWSHWWEMKAPAATTNRELLECSIRRAKPHHTELLFIYEG